MSYSDLLNYAFRILSIKNYSEKEIIKKLTQRCTKCNSSEKDVAKIIKRLKELKLIDDLNYARSIIRNRTTYNPCGIYLIKQKLYQKQLSEGVINQAISEEYINEEELALAFLKQKSHRFHSLDRQKKREKILRSLSQRGFSSHVIAKMLQKTTEIDNITTQRIK